MLVQSSLPPLTLLEIMQRAELRFGRKRSFKNAPRTLDVDILYASAKVRACEWLALPHPSACERISVILPLGEMKFKRGLICKLKS